MTKTINTPDITDTNFDAFKDDLLWYISEILAEKSNTGSIRTACEYYMSLSDNKKETYIKTAYETMHGLHSMYDVITKTTEKLKEGVEDA